MVRFLSKAAFGLAAFVALPSAAQAGTTTASATVTMQVASQCTLSGANVHLGSFKTNDTWGTVGAKHGSVTVLNYAVGTVGQESLSFGSVTCDPGLPWSLSIKGTNGGFNAVGAIKITLNGKVSVMYPGIRRVGGVQLSDSSPYFLGTGVQAWSTNVSQVGTGAAQELRGNITVSYTAQGVTGTQAVALGAAGSGSDTLTYTLTF